MSFQHKLKHLSVRLGLQVVKIILAIKPVTFRFFRLLAQPILILWKFILFIVVPIYRMTYSFRKYFLGVYRSAKNKIMFLLANRVTVHVVAGIILIFVLGLNFQSEEVRAETFGERSLMYRLVVDQGVQLVEEYVDFDQVRTDLAHRYLQSGTVRSLSQGREVDLESIYVRSYSVDDGRISARVSSRSEGSVAPREEIIKYTVSSGDTLSTIARDRKSVV